MRRFTLITIIGLFAVLLAAAVYQIALVTGKPRNLPGPGLTGGEDRVILRDLTGRSRQDAVAEIERVDLAYRVEPAGAPHDDRVVGQDPPPGTLLDEGDTVTLRVRCEPAPCPAPPEGEEIVDPCSCATA